MGGRDPRSCVRVVEAGGPSFEHHLLVRDYLRAHAQRCAGYGERRARATAADDDLRTYVAAKVDALAALTDAARDWRHPSVRGDRLRLRPSGEDDVELIHRWIADSRVHRT